MLHLLRQTPQQITGWVRNDSADLLDGEVRQQRTDGGLGLVDEDGLRDAKADGRPAQLCEGLPPGTAADVSGNDLHGGHGERELGGGAGAQAQQDLVAIDVGKIGELVDGVQARRARDAEDAGEDVPRHIVARPSSDQARDNADDGLEHDVGQHAHAGPDGRVGLDELEVEGQEVDRHEDVGCAAGHLEEEHDHGCRPEEVHGEHAAFRRGADGEVLLAEEGEEEDKGQREEGDNLTRVPGVQHTTEADSHNDGDDEADDEDNPEEVDLLGPLQD